jgi:serine/threonine protein phosphatase PrpC
MVLALTSGSAQHIGARPNQQDCMEIVHAPSGGVLAILCDGMGGMEDGQLASSTAIQAFRDCFLVRGSLFEAAGVANAAVTALLRNTGTTLIAAYVAADQFEWISIGDSPMYLLRDGLLRQINYPHIFANRLSPEEAEAHPERDALTSYVGIPFLTEIDQSHGPVALHAGDRILLASDGLSRVLEPPEILSTINGDAQRSSELLIEKVLARKHFRQDNVSVITVCLDDPALADSSPVYANRAHKVASD